MAEPAHLPSRVLRAIVRGHVGAALRRVSDDLVLQLTSGPVYRGPEGVVHLVVDRARYARQRVTLRDPEPLGGGYHLLAGELRQAPLHEEPEIVPGAWLGHVSHGVLTALIYHRTRPDALRSLPWG